MFKQTKRDPKSLENYKKIQKTKFTSLMVKAKWDLLHQSDLRKTLLVYDDVENNK